jgi:ribulose 1,5-bisphosphate synthetase/thiazole synthase
VSSWFETPLDVAIVGAGPAGYCAAAIPGLDEDQQRKVYGGTAVVLYGIERGVLA